MRRFNLTYARPAPRVSVPKLLILLGKDEGLSFDSTPYGLGSAHREPGMTEPTRAAIYARKSSKDKQSTHSTADQIEACRRYAQRRGRG
jgi:hypothetical protein